MHQDLLFPQEKSALYPLLAQQMTSLAQDSLLISTLANASALLFEALPDINWAGFYLLRGEMLHLGPFQGKTACTQIPLGRGVCGTAAATRQVQLVPDVAQFPSHIACDRHPGRKSSFRSCWKIPSLACWILIRRCTIASMNRTLKG